MTAGADDTPHWVYRDEGRLGPTGELLFTKPDRNLILRLGYPVDEEVTDPSSWLDWTLPEDVQRSWSMFRALARGEVWQGRARATAADGAVCVFEVRCTPTRQPNGETTVLVESRDVTEIAELEAALNDREARLRLLSEELGVAMWNTDEALRFTWSAGPAFEKLGFEENAMVGTTFYEVLGTEDPTVPAIAAHERALEGEPADYEVEWQERTWRARVEPLRDPLGRIVGVLGIAVDLTAVIDVARRTQRPLPVAQLDRDGVRPEDGEYERLTLADLTIDPESFRVTKGSKEVHLTVSEFKLLMEFALCPGRVLSRQLLAERVWGGKFYGDGASVTMAISRLRDKIEDDPGNPTIIETVRGLGYRSIDGTGT